MADKLDIKQGTLALMILRTLEVLGPLHGYGVARLIEETSKNRLRLNYGTLYPALLKLEQEGLVKAEWGQSENNRRAKYYALTAAGRRQLAREARGDADRREDLQAHLDMDTAEYVRRGMHPDEARRQALLASGGLTQAAEAVRDRRGLPWLESIAADFRYAARALRKSPGFATVAVLTLALGIGANTAIFSVVRAVLLKPLPYRDPEQLIRVFETSASQPRFPMSAGDFQHYRQQNSTLAGLALYTRQDLELTMGDQAELLSGLRITSGFFDVVGVPTLLGREFRREDEAPGNHHVVILSNRLW